MFYKQKRLSLIHITINTSAFFLVIKYFYKMQNKSLKNLVKNQDLLKFLGAKVKSKYRKAIIQIADRNLIKSICEAALNLLKGYYIMGFLNLLLLLNHLLLLLFDLLNRLYLFTIRCLFEFSTF